VAAEQVYVTTLERWPILTHPFSEVPSPLWQER
jgi:hypothetical protein